MKLHQFPNQKVSKSKKTKQWHIDCVEALINEASFNSTDKAELRNLYNVANNEIDDTLYKYVTNPYNSEIFRKMNFPAKIRNYPIISPILNLLMGEKIKRPHNYQVVAVNSDSVTEAQKELFNVALDLYSRVFINELNKQQDSGIPDQDIQQPQQVLQELSANPADKRAIVGQEALDYIRYDLELDHEFQKIFYDYLVSGYCYTFKDVQHDSIVYERVSPLEIDVKKAPDVEYVEDAEAIIRRKLMSVSSVIAKFYDVLTEAEISELENPTEHREGGLFTPFYEQIVNDQHQLDHRLIEVIHCTWMSFRKVGILTYYENGVPQQLEVDESYEPLPDEEIEWIWLREVRQGYRIDNRYYKELNRIKAQRNEIDELAECKQPYNGIRFSDQHAENKSLVKIGLPFQILHNINHYRFELTLAKNKDKIILMPIDAIPKEDGWDEYKFMYFADAMGFAFIKPKEEGVAGFNQYQVLDASLSQYIKTMIDIMAAIKQEWEETIGITRQRKGEVAASDSVTGTQEAVFRSSVITEELFRKFEKFEEKELQGLLDLSKIAWINGKKAMYVNSDMRTAILSIDPLEYMETSYGVFVRNSGKENEKFEILKNYAQAAIQNGLPLSSMVDILEANNFSKLKDIIRKAEEAQQQVEQSIEQQRLQLEQQLAELEIAAKQAEIQEGDKQRAHEADQNELDRRNKIDIELIKAATGEGANPDIDQDAIPDASEIVKQRNEQLKIAVDDKHRTREGDQKDRELDIKEKEMASKERIEKLKAKTALKNKVAGEGKTPKKK